MTTRPFAPAYPHGPLEEVFDGVFLVKGTIRMKMGFTMSFSRNMAVVRTGESLTLINSVRLDDEGLARLDSLGRVEHVIRLAAGHGSDDRFYKDRYDAKIWQVKGQIYAAGFAPNPTPADAYFAADVEVGEGDALPIPGARLYTFPSARLPEGVLLLDRDGGLMISGDPLQNWPKTDEYFNFAGALVMRLMGFIKPHNIGPGWAKGTKVAAADLRRLLELEFEHVLPAHGELVRGGAREKYRPAIEAFRG